MIELPVIGKAQAEEAKEQRTKKPPWLKVKLPVGQQFKNVRKIVSEYKLF